MTLNIQSSSGRSLSLETEQVKVLDLRDRALFAAKKAGVFFALAVASVFIPVFHFVLVPLFLLLTILTFWKKSRAHWKFENLEFDCLECSTRLRLNDGFEKPPFRVFCNFCHQHLKIVSV